MIKWLAPPFVATYKGIGKVLIRLHVHPNVVTLAGTAGVLFGALWFFPRAGDHIYALFIGTMVCWWCALLDMTDGMIARATGKSSRFGAFLDSTLDRFADAAVFGGIAWGMIDYHRITALAALLCLTLGSFVPYARARAEGLGVDTKSGIATRADRLTIGLIAAGLVGLGVHVLVLTYTLFFLSAAAFITVIQRGWDVWKANKLSPALPQAR
ncbi:MAG: CDP-alcohol phosphatidyltransferase family protein [Demequinaceae bacterium]|nr:CDP-alcohol phosphatidyltransferase family protein [Demequinaceae bacterium]